MRRTTAPIDYQTGKSKHDPEVLAMGTCWKEYNDEPTPGRSVGPMGYKLMKVAGFVWCPQSAGYEQYYINGLNAVDGAMSRGLGDGRVCVYVHPTVGRGDGNDDGDYLYICSVGCVEWPAYLNASELAVFIALADEEFRELMLRANWRIDSMLENESSLSRLEIGGNDDH